MPAPIVFDPSPTWDLKQARSLFCPNVKLQIFGAHKQNKEAKYKNTIIRNKQYKTPGSIKHTIEMQP